MVRPSGIMAWEDGIEPYDAVLVGLLDPAEEGRVDVCCIVAVAVSALHDARVDARGVAVPDIPPEVRDGVTRLDVNELTF